jgi:hypothetical protein
MKMRKPILIVTAMAAVLTVSAGAYAASEHHTSSTAGPRAGSDCVAADLTPKDAGMACPRNMPASPTPAAASQPTAAKQQPTGASISQ